LWMVYQKHNIWKTKAALILYLVVELKLGGVLDTDSG